MPLAVYVLGLSVFCLGTTEFMVSGLLPELAREFGISVASAGLLISAFALAVALGAPLLSLLGLQLRRKTALLVLLAVFTLGQILAATAQTYSWLLTARIVTALAFGPFFAVGAVAAADLASEAKRARAISVMFGGLTMANIVGVPVGTFIGEHWGWRGAFWVVGVLSAIALAGAARLLPTDTDPVRRRTDLKAEFEPFKRPDMWVALSTTALSQAALFAVFTYISPFLTESAGFATGAVAPMLVLFGIGTCFGSFVGGRVADRHLEWNLSLGLLVLVLTIALLGPAARNQTSTVLAVFLFAAAAFAINPALQAQVMRKARSAPTLASAVNIAAFNIGNTVGPWLSGIVIDAGYGYRALPFVGAGLAAAALAASIVSWHLRSSSTRVRAMGSDIVSRRS
jgi:DHA1 family inner membrane transport protein